MHKKLDETYCPAAAVQAWFADKWAMAVLVQLHEGGPRRFGELWRSIPRVSEKVLAATLDRLERDGLVTRTSYPEVPPRVEYAATTLAASLYPHLAALLQWGRDHLGEIRRNRERYPKGG